jgi:hypothetical protein
MGDMPAMWLGRVVVALLGWAAVTHGAETFGWVLLAVAVFSWWRMRQPIRYCLAWVGLVVLRAYVVRKLAPYRDQLGDLGSARDPDAQWMQILQSRCGTCGA